MCSNFWAKPKKEIDLKRVKESFIKDFKYIMSLGYVPSHRKHNTGIGKTLEDLMEVEENNLSLADYKGSIELKSQRAYTGSMLTLFTKSPSYPNSANSTLREQYGYPDPETGLNILHTTIKYSDYNNFKNTWGFKLEINRNKERIYLLVKNLKTNKIEDYKPLWIFEELRDKLSIKCSLIAYITAKTRKNNKREEFHFTNAILLSGITFEKFLEFIERDIILFDIRIGVYRSGKLKGKTHDHGSGFRVGRQNISNVFEIDEISSSVQKTLF